MTDVDGLGPAVALTTLGCKLNQAETEDLARKFYDAGFRVVDIDAVADVYVINTCTVTHIADRKSRQIIRQAKRLNPSALIAATGCYVDVSPSDVQKIDHVDLIVKNQDKPRIAELVRDALGEKLVLHENQECDHLPVVNDTPLARTRSFVKIEDGCNKFCSFCIVPLARGRERSVPIDDVIASIKKRVDAGHKEIVITGVHIGTYGKDLKAQQRVSLNDLVKAILERTNLARLRLSSIEPMDFKEEMLSIWSDPRVCRHLHLPLQSGCDATLRRMRRRYTQKRFAAIVEQIRNAIPGVAITTDIIVGFPGETDSEFEESYSFAKEMGFAAIHVFKYSPRRGTLAATMSDQVDYQVKKARSDALLQLSTESTRAFATKFIGQSLEVLFETQVTREEQRYWEGLTDNYLRILAVDKSQTQEQRKRWKDQRDLTNQFGETDIVEFVDGHLVGFIKMVLP